MWKHSLVFYRYFFRDMAWLGNDLARAAIPIFGSICGSIGLGIGLLRGYYTSEPLHEQYLYPVLGVLAGVTLGFSLDAGYNVGLYRNCYQSGCSWHCHFYDGSTMCSKYKNSKIRIKYLDKVLY